jgi:hypothetical protein
MRARNFIDTVSDLSYTTLFTLWGSSIIVFALSYALLSYIPGHGPIGIDGSFSLRIANSLYYSVITATNTGYGDIAPLGASRALAATQSIAELFLFALFIAKLVSRRQDASLSEVHKLTFELSFHTIRESFYLARKDFDCMMEAAREGRSFSASDWERIAIAYQHIGSLMQDVPNFYAVTSDLYIIDPRREILLLEAVLRTMLRLEAMLEEMEKNGVTWRADTECLKELSEMLASFEEIVPVWREHAHVPAHADFSAIAASLETIHRRVTG